MNKKNNGEKHEIDVEYILTAVQLMQFMPINEEKNYLPEFHAKLKSVLF